MEIKGIDDLDREILQTLIALEKGTPKQISTILKNDHQKIKQKLNKLKRKNYIKKSTNNSYKITKRGKNKLNKKSTSITKKKT